MSASPPTTRPLDGLRILDFSRSSFPVELFPGQDIADE